MDQVCRLTWRATQVNLNLARAMNHKVTMGRFNSKAVTFVSINLY